MKIAASLIIGMILLFTSCEKNSSTMSTNPTSNNSGCSGGPSTVTDRDGNVYNVVSIGNQCWMKENLKTTRYKNGATIPSTLNNSQWNSTTSGACTDYNYNISNSEIYGKLYNWYAVADSRGLCPTGWHVPSESEWTTMENYLGGSTIAGGAMKEISTIHWASPNTGATNSSGFNGLPGGKRDPNGTFSTINKYGYWYSSTQSSIQTTVAYSHYLDYLSSDLNNYNNIKTFGFSVRCVRD